MANADLVRLVARLDLDVGRVGICHACLGFVSFPLGDGDEAGARREARRMTPILWEEGLAGPALAAARRARDEGLPGAERLLADLERGGGHCAAARAIVLRLAGDLHERTRVELRLEAGARPRLALAPPELN